VFADFQEFNLKLGPTEIQLKFAKTTHKMSNLASVFFICVTVFQRNLYEVNFDSNSLKYD
jgi:hypothetical protein